MLKITGSLRFLDRPSRTGWTSPTAPTARLRQQRWTRLLAAGLACVLAAACTSPVRRRGTADQRGIAVANPTATIGPRRAGGPRHPTSRGWTLRSWTI